MDGNEDQASGTTDLLGLNSSPKKETIDLDWRTWRFGVDFMG